MWGGPATGLFKPDGRLTNVRTVTGEAGSGNSAVTHSGEQGMEFASY